MATARYGRIMKELELLHRQPPFGVSVWQTDDNNLSYLNAQLMGPVETPYENGLFKLTIELPPEYPNEPPKITFVTKIYHPNIDSNGRICLEVLKPLPKGCWTPAWNISSVLQSIQQLLREPNASDPLDIDIAKEFEACRRKFDEKAVLWTQKYAKASSFTSDGHRAEEKTSRSSAILASKNSSDELPADDDLSAACLLDVCAVTMDDKICSSVRSSIADKLSVRNRKVASSTLQKSTPKGDDGKLVKTAPASLREPIAQSLITAAAVCSTLAKDASSSSEDVVANDDEDFVRLLSATAKAADTCEPRQPKKPCAKTAPCRNHSAEMTSEAEQTDGLLHVKKSKKASLENSHTAKETAGTFEQIFDAVLKPCSSSSTTPKTKFRQSCEDDLIFGPNDAKQFPAEPTNSSALGLGAKPVLPQCSANTRTSKLSLKRVRN